MFEGVNLFGFWIVHFSDLFDILLVSLFFFYIFHLFRGSRAEQMFMGLFILGGIYFLSIWWDLKGVQWLFGHLLTVGVVSIVILFQPEIRGAFTRIGINASHLHWKKLLFYPDEGRNVIDAIIEATLEMSRKQIGGLMVVERKVGLKNYMDTGVYLNADVTPELIKSIFFPKSPLHDGAVILSEGRIKAAGCTLPIFTQKLTDSSYGMRHRAAETIANESDAVVVVVSEETGRISVVVRNHMHTNLTADELEWKLIEMLESEYEK